MRSIIEKKLRSSSKPLLFLFDYDGTLTPLVDRPEEAVMCQRHRETLLRFIQCPGIAVALVSGRSVQQLQGFLPELQPEPLLFCGLHGAEIWCNREQRFLRSPDPAVRTTVDGLYQLFSGFLSQNQASFSGVLLEHKTHALVLHTRMASEAAALQAAEQFKIYAGQLDLQGQFALKPGKNMLEFLPKGFHKGDAVQFVMDRYPTHTAIYFGDDLTDEDAFKVVRDQQGLTVLVGPPAHVSRAEFHLEDVEDLHALLAGYISKS